MRLETPADVERYLKEREMLTIPRAEGPPLQVPCMSTVLVSRDLVAANTYNPNRVSGDKMSLLALSIQKNGFCYAVMTVWDPELEKVVIVDGFHRHEILGPDWLGCEYVPCGILDLDVAQRMAATMQFNKARGVHQIDLDAEVVRSLLEQGLDEEDVATRLGIDEEDVHRYKQITGVAELFQNTDYSQAWEMELDGG